MAFKIVLDYNLAGKSPAVLSRDIQLQLQNARNRILEDIRRELVRTAPRKSKGNKWSENKIYNYLVNPANCVRRYGRYRGAVVLDTRRLPHLKYVVKDVRPGGWIYPVKKRALKICYPRQPAGAICGQLYHRVRGHKGNNFIERAYIRAQKWVRYRVDEYLRIAVYS